MIFFLFSFLASVFGSLSTGNIFGVHFNLQLSVGNPFSGIISFWPFVVVLVLLLLSIMWYQAIRAMRRRKAKGSERRQPAAQSTLFLGIVTVFVLVLIAAPYVLESFDDSKVNKSINAADRIETTLTVHGMDCGGCESLVNRRVANLSGVESVEASHVNEHVHIVYDKSKVSLALIAQTIEESGYTVVLE